MKSQLQQLLHQARQRHLNNQNASSNRNCLNESYQEYQFLNLKPRVQSLIHALEVLVKHASFTFQKNFATLNYWIFKVAQNPLRYSSILLTLSENILGLLHTESRIRISHQNHSSQIILLAFYIKCLKPEKQISVVSSKESLINWSLDLIDSKSADPLSDLRRLCESMKISLHLIEESYKTAITHTDQILILDLMNSQAIQYKPLLLALKNNLSVPQSVIIYHSHYQESDVQNVLSFIDAEFQLTEAALTYPIEIEYIQKDTQIKRKLVQFLLQEQNHPEKQDIIIFYRNQHLSNSTSNRFSSKLKEILNEKGISSHVQIITAKNEIIIDGKNHIFIVQNVHQLTTWKYSYFDVFYVIDYGWDVYYKMDYESNCFIEGLKKSDLKQKTKRLSFVGINKVGRYIYHQHQISESSDYLSNPSQIMTYVINMIDLKLQQYLEHQHSRVIQCLKNLLKVKVISKDELGKYTIEDQNFLKYNQLGLDPLQVYAIKNCLQKQKDSERKVLSNIALMTFSILNTRGSLRQGRDGYTTKTVAKPSGIWRKTGYLDSCIEILTKAEILETKKSSSRSFSKRKTSKYNEEQHEIYGGIFEQVLPHKMEFQEMQMDDMLRQYFVNPLIFAEIRAKLDELRQSFEIQQTNIKLEENLLEEALQNLIKEVPTSILTFSGIRRNGYLYKHEGQTKANIFPAKDSLMSQLNQNPQFVVVLRWSECEGKRQILMHNNLNHESVLNGFSQILSKKSDQLAQQEIEFHGISSSIFNGLFRNNGTQMTKFENEHKCFVQPNEQMATIFLFCSKDGSENIKQAFEDLLKKVKEKYVNTNKILHYLGNTNLSMSNGGQIKDIIKDKYIIQCYLNNLSLQITEEDLEELFDEFFVLKSIEVLDPEKGKFSKSAIIKFNSQKDYYRFKSYYNECLYCERFFQVKPIQIKPSNSVQAEMYIDFKWFVWKSHQKALVVFKSIQNAQQAFKAIQNYPKIDQTPTKRYLDKNKITLQNLSPSVDEIFLEKYFGVYGEIKEIQILKTPLKQMPNQQNFLDRILKDALEIPLAEDNNERYKIHPIQKHKNGLRKCKVHVKTVQNLTKLIQKLNGIKGKIGQGRLYTESIYTKPIMIQYPSILSLYQQLFEETVSQAPKKPNISFTIRDQNNGRPYMILKSPMNHTLEYISSQFQKKLQPFSIQLTEEKSNIFLSDIGISNLIDLEEKFNCKLIVNSVKKTLSVICRFSNLKQIKEEIAARVDQKFFYRITLNTRSYKNLYNDKSKLQQIKIKYELSLLDLEEYSKTLIFEGSAYRVQCALNYMMHVIESFTKSEEELINTEVCLICYEQSFRPYRLQNCGHKFCFGCLNQCINSVLGDITMFPIKCPHCMKQVTIDDLQSLVDAPSWPKLINIATNHFVNRNAETMTFCYTPGCKQICLLTLSNFKCDVCEVIYCTKCKQRCHDGLTCEEARLGSDRLFKKYMEENGVRQCPYKNCKMPIIRTDGCYRVTCSRCNKSMCFKCQPKKMVAYETSTECYAHLNDAHGGYW